MLRRLSDLDDPHPPLGIARTTLAARTALARLGLSIRRLTDDGVPH